jgi:hypothetical protein
MESRQKFVLTILILCCVSCIGGVILATTGALEAKRSGAIEGTEEFYVKKFELDKLKKILVDAIAADTVVTPKEKTAGDFLDIDEYIEYKIQWAAGKKVREETVARSQPHIDKLKRWCAKHYDALERFKKSETLMILYLDGTQRKPIQFYARYMDDVSNEGKQLLKKVCKK